MHRRELMTAWGFSADPFVQYIAEIEDRLEQSFVAPNYFEDIVGDPENPWPTFVFGSRGEGKSTLCRMVGEHLRKLERPPLVVETTDFSSWSVEKIDGSARGVSLDDHVWLILAAAAITLVEALEANPGLLGRLTAADRSLLESFVIRLLPALDVDGHGRRFTSMLDGATGNRLPRGRRGLRWLSRYLRRKRFEFEQAKLQNANASLLLAALMLIAPSMPSSLSSGGTTSQTAFDEFLRLVRGMGFPSMYVLVDKIDETDAVADRPDRVRKLVEPLARSVRFLESNGLGIKIFLPEEIHRDLAGIRTDRIRAHRIQWDEQRLRLFLRKRIQAYSDGRLVGIEHMFEDYAAFEPQLLRASARAPRSMLRILHLIVGRHCEQESPSTVIGDDAVEAGLRTFREYRKQEGDLELYEARLNAWDLEHGSKDEPS